MKGERMQPNTQKCTVLSVSGGIQGVMGRLETGNSEKNAQPVGVFKKMTARSGWDDQIRVFLQPRYAYKKSHTILRRQNGIIN